MEQHPIPQAITTYEFRLVGEMTLKQFVKLTFGLGLAFLFYISPLPFYAKWPLIAIFSLLGIGLAFIPIEGRPLETWIVSFIKAIYSPTEYIYKKTPQLPEFFEKGAAIKTVTTPSPPPIVPGRTKLKEYLGALPAEEKTTAWEQAEKRFLAQVGQAFEEIQLSSSPPKTAKKATKVEPTALPETPKVTTSAPTPPSPLATDKPNIIAGIIKNKEDQLVEGAIIEVKDSQNFPVRALKTNSLGQFKSVSPLENGTYQIEVEKEDLNFDIIKINLKGKIIPPLEIKEK